MADENLTYPQYVRPVRIGLRQDILNQYADEKWHCSLSMEKHLDVTQRQLRDAMSYLLHGMAKGKADKKKVGSHYHYRIFRKSDKTVASAELREKLHPIQKILEEEGRKPPARMSIPTVAHQAAVLKSLIKEWCE